MKSWTNEQLIKAVKVSQTFAEVGRNLGLATYGANSKTIQKYIKILQLDISHFLSRGEQLKKARELMEKMSYEEILSINNVDRKHIKQIIIVNKLLDYRCQVCNIFEWNDQKLSLHLDHINGINNDNRLENLRFLCPNCHSLTDNYCGKNRKSKMITIEHKCVDCSEVIHRMSTRCKKCNILNKKQLTKIEWLPTKQLIDLVKEMGYTQAGKQLGVSGNGIKKRIRNYPND